MKNEFGEDLSWVGNLAGFIGTTQYHRWSPLNSVLTDGAKYLADNAGCYWMFDTIEIMVQKHKAQHGLCFNNRLVVSTIEVDMDQYTAVITAENGNGKVIADSYIEFTNFPLEKFEVWAQYYHPISGWVHMLPGEY